MRARVNTKSFLLAVFLLGKVLFSAAEVDAAAPWFGRGGPKPTPKEEERRRNLYREQRFIRHLYQGFLNRQPSPDEVRFWSDRLGRSLNPTELVKEFMESDEYFVRQTYLGLLHREPDPAGMNSSMRALRGGQSRSEVIEALLGSEEFRKRLR